MAFHKHIKLPPLRLTRRCGGNVKVDCVHRGVAMGSQPAGQESRLKMEDNGDVNAAVSDLTEHYDNESSGLLSEPSDHHLHGEASAKNWSKLRMAMLHNAVEGEAMPVEQTCLCCSKLVVFRCQECGPLVYYCYECFSKQHSRTNFFHVAEKWEGDHYQICLCEPRKVNIRPLHVCHSSKEIPVTCVNEKGVEVTLQIICCDCEPLAVTLARGQLWPASPSHPQYAFSFGLLDLAEALLLECQVALKDLCQAIYFRSPSNTIMKRDIYSCLIDAFEEYRYFKHEMRQLSFLFKILDSGNVCPAMPQRIREGGIYALDALFGLPRKRSAGINHGRHFMETSSFWISVLLMSMLARNNYNLKELYRLAYPFYMINTLLERHPQDTIQMYVMYVIACTLRKHLQIEFGQLRCAGVGLSDGETMERLWSYLRRYGRMTKEMRPSHRTDILVHALVHYGRKTKAKLGNLLVARRKRAESVYTASTETFSKLVETYDGGGVTQNIVEEWIAEEAVIATRGERDRGTFPNWRCEYVILLQSYMNLQSKLAQISLKQQQKLALCSEVSKLNRRLQEIEKERHIPCRWDAKDPEFMQVQHHFSDEKQTQLAEAMWASSSRRQFLLKMKAKYADGQKIAKKLSAQLTKETRNLKGLLEEYNACKTISTGSNLPHLEITDVLESSSLAKILNPTLITYKPDRQEIINSYLMLTRSCEEIKMLQGEMENVLHYHEERIDSIQSIMDENRQDRGAYAILHRMSDETHKLLAKCRVLFTPYLSCPSALYVESSSESLSESESSDDDSDISDDNLFA